jgi:formate hydrogenlyase transcriptional activator
LEIANLLTTKLEPEVLFDTITRVLVRFLNIDRASLALYDVEHDEFQIVALAIQEGSLLGKGWFIPHCGSRVGRAFDSRQPFCSTLGVETELFEDVPLVKEGMHFSVAIPMVVDGKPIGTFNVNRRRDQEFTSADLELLTRVADQIAIAVANSRKFESIERQKQGLHRENTYLQELMRTNPSSYPLLLLPSMQSWLGRLTTIAKVDATVLITGETGTGKSILARALHDWSERHDRPFVKCDCATLSTQLIESELFGHEKGSFTGAHSRRIGRFEFAHGGTLFLDEIGDMPLETQVKLLGALQDRQFYRVGGAKPVAVDIRVIAASNRDLQAEVRAGRLRQDLFYRLNVVTISLPPLRERLEDLESLARHFIQVYGRKLRRNVTSLSPGALATMRSYSWPGNIRELENVIERALLIDDSPVLRIGGELLGYTTKETMAAADQLEKLPLLTLAEMETRYIQEVLNATSWRISGPGGAAHLLGLHPNTLRSRMERLGISRPH